MKKIRFLISAMLSFFITPLGIHASMQSIGSNLLHLERVASSTRQWTGVAVSQTGRIFVNFPKWNQNASFGPSVVEIKGSKEIPYPNQSWNQYWSGQTKNPLQQLISVQAVYIDENDDLWLVDTGNPNFSGIVPSGKDSVTSAKLVRIDLASNQVIQVVYFPPGIVLPGSYTNDIRIDREKDVAYLTDSEKPAILVIEDLTKQPRFKRLLTDHPSTQSEGIDVVINGKPWRNQGMKPVVHADGIALHPSKKFLCYQALTAKHSYCVPTADLLANESSIRVLTVGALGAADGLEFDANGYLYHSSIEHNAVRRLLLSEEILTEAFRNGQSSLNLTDNDFEPLAVDQELLAWPDSFSIAGGYLYVTASRIHQPAASIYHLTRFHLESIKFVDSSGSH